MKTYFSFIYTLLFLSLSAQAQTITKEERKFAMDYLQETKKEAIQTVGKLSDQQLRFKPDENSWSIAQCIEHIVLSEDLIFGLSQKALDSSSAEGELKFSDETLIKAITDRSNKAKAQEPLQPKNTFGSAKAGLEAFEEKRDTHISYLKKTNDPLRERYFDLPFGKVDAYQVILFMAAHSQRHLLQIEEIMDHPDFPR